MKKVTIEAKAVVDRTRSWLSGYEAVQRSWDERFGDVGGQPVNLLRLAIGDIDGGQ